MRALNDLQTFVKVSRITYIALPFGTGNDLARNTNWGPHAHQPHLQKLEEICFEICCNSNSQQVNIWDVHFVIRNDGDIQSIRDNRATSILDKSRKAQKNSEKGTYTYTAFMALYFSIGDDAKIGFDFEANRTASRCANKCRYVCSTIKYWFCGCCFYTERENAPLRNNLAYVRKRQSFANK